MWHFRLIMFVFSGSVCILQEKEGRRKRKNSGKITKIREDFLRFSYRDGILFPGGGFHGSTELAS